MSAFVIRHEGGDTRVVEATEPASSLESELFDMLTTCNPGEVTVTDTASGVAYKVTFG